MFVVLNLFENLMKAIDLSRKSAHIRSYCFTFNCRGRFIDS